MSIRFLSFLCGTLVLIGLSVMVDLRQAANAADLFNPAQATSLVSDRRAERVGDILTVLIYETSSASNTASSTTGKNFGLHGQVSSNRGRSDGGQLEVGNDFGGQGRVERTGRVIAQISVLVQEVKNNGDLLVAGQQAIDVNGEKTDIRLQGRVRPIDITSSNTVLSTRLAEASIEYVGNGYVTENSKPGLIPRFLNWLGLW